MATKTYRTGHIVDETSKSVKTPGIGHTHCPKCDGLTSSRNLQCEKCGKVRVAKKKLTVYVPKTKTVPMSVHTAALAEIIRLQKDIVLMKKMMVSKVMETLKNL